MTEQNYVLIKLTSSTDNS